MPNNFITNHAGNEKNVSMPIVKTRNPVRYLKGSYRVLRFLVDTLFVRELRYLRCKPIDTLFFLTYRCSSKCKTCTLWKRTDESNELTLKEWKKAAEISAEMGAKYIELFGGDALLRPDVLMPLVAHISTIKGVKSDLVTNGILMSEEIARGLVDAGLDDLWLSIDGVSDAHNQVRGNEKSWDQIEKTINWFKSFRGSTQKPCLHANTTISALNYHSFDEVLFYAERNGFDSIHLEYAGEFWDDLLDQSTIDGVKPNPYFIRQDDQSILLNEEQANVVKHKVEQMKKNARYMRINLQSENIDKLSIRQMVTGFCDNRRCYITRGKITIDPLGNVLGCPFFGNWILGNLRKENLKKIWRNKKHIKFLDHFSKRHIKMCDHCIIGVQRNPTPIQELRDFANQIRGHARR